MNSKTDIQNQRSNDMSITCREHRLFCLAGDNELRFMDRYQEVASYNSKSVFLGFARQFDV